ncbi:unnamed protein product, partial [Effrenium voratum]
RLPVMVRNPFRRVQSWFRHKWLANKGKEPYATWAGFLPFLRYMWEHRSDANDPNGFWKRVLKRPFNMLDAARPSRQGPPPMKAATTGPIPNKFAMQLGST